MNAIPAIERLADAMEREGINEIRRWPLGYFTVKLSDGRSGLGKSPREAIDTATHERLGVAA